MLGLGLKLSLGVVLSSCLWQASPLSQSEYRKEDKETRGKEEGITCNPKCQNLGRFAGRSGRYWVVFLMWQVVIRSFLKSKKRKLWAAMYDIRFI